MGMELKMLVFIGFYKISKGTFAPVYIVLEVLWLVGLDELTIADSTQNFKSGRRFSTIIFSSPSGIAKHDLR